MIDNVVKRSVVVAGQKTSVSLEEAFWREIPRIAKMQGLNKSQFITAIDRDRKGRSLSSSLRIAVLEALKGEINAYVDTLKARLTPREVSELGAFGNVVLSERPAE